MKTRLLLAGAIGAFSVLGFYAYQYAAIGSAYTAHILCSGVFVSARSAQSVLGSDLSVDSLAPLRYVTAEVDPRARRVSAHVFGLATRTALYRDRLGCVLEEGQTPSPSGSVVVWTQTRDEWDRKDDQAGGVDAQKLSSALDWAFAEPDPSRMRRTRAVVIVHDGRLVAERYADGITKDTPLLGWSMSKSVVNALAGILVKVGDLSLDAPLGIDAWPEGDPRHAITLSQLLRMSSGLHFDEESINPRGDVLYMLLGAHDVAAYASSQPLEAPPGTRWSYSSGTTNIIAGAMRRAVGDKAYPTFPRRALFDRIGMHSAVLETDASGTFIGSSFMYATARDWARLGQLYLDDGLWRGERILPEGWVAYSRTPAPAAPNGQYGAHFWLQVPDGYRGNAPPLPADAFHAAGHEGQFVTMVPSRRAVIVRLGLTRHAGAWAHDEFVARVLDALGQ